MAGNTTKTAFWRGFRDGSPFMLGAAPFALVFGVLATEAGLSLFQAMSMSVLVIAGASQFAALAQMQENAPVALVLGAALMVNLRMAMYSASLAPYLGAAPFWQRAAAAYVLVDNAYVVSYAQFEKQPDMPVSDRMAYYFGCVVPVWIVWYGFSFAGAYFGTSIPPEWGLDFAVPIAFLAIVSPMLKTGAHMMAAVTSVLVALLLSGLPYSMGLFIAALAAMLVGSEIERRRQGQAT